MPVLLLSPLSPLLAHLLVASAKVGKILPDQARGFQLPVLRPLLAHLLAVLLASADPASVSGRVCYSQAILAAFAQLHVG